MKCPQLLFISSLGLSVLEEHIFLFFCSWLHDFKGQGFFFPNAVSGASVFMLTAHLHPAGPSEWKPGPHLSHFSPVTPARHGHLPSASHCRLTEPEHDSREKEGGGKKEDEIPLRKSTKGWTQSIYHYSFGRHNRIAVIEFLCSFQMLAQNNLTRFKKNKKNQRKIWQKRKLMKAALFYQYNELQKPLQNHC